MLSLSVSTDIDATAPAVWQVLTDLAGFREWNPFIHSASGDVRVGGRVELHLRPMPALPLRFRATVLVCEPNHELRWRGHFLSPWIGSGEHFFLIEEVSRGRVRLVQREIFTGVLPLLGAGLLERKARHGFEAMNAALKARVEHVAPPQPVRVVG